MDIYTNPPNYTYVTGITKLFTMPTDSGGIPAVAVTKKTADYITSTYTILMILVFMAGWNLIIAIIMGFWPTRGDPNRQTALVALWNSGESMNAMWLMLSYCRRMIDIFRPEKRTGSKDREGQPSQAVAGQGPDGISAISGSGQRDLERQGWTPGGTSVSKWEYGKSNLLWGMLFASIALAMTLGNIVAGILVPVQLSMGNVAPPAIGIIFYPNTLNFARNDDNGVGLSKLASLTAPSALRALGSIEASDVTVRKRVNIVEIPPRDIKTAVFWAGRDYNYDVTGVDMGLQSDPKLKLRINGSCHTEYSWVKSTDQGDIYTLFGGNQSHTVDPQTRGDIPPTVTFIINGRDIEAKSSNISFALIVDTAGRYSYTSGQDPWYATEKAGGDSKIAYQVQRGRPALSCWEERKWHLNGKDVEGPKLSTLPGLKLSELWAKKAFIQEFTIPRMISLGKAAGPSALKSASYARAPEYVLDAGSSRIVDDLERLVLGGWVSSRNVLRDTTTYPLGDKGIPNLFAAQGGGVDPSVAKFVLQSGDVVTLSVRILISVPAILLFLLLVQQVLDFVLRRSHLAQYPIFDKRGNVYVNWENASDKKNAAEGEVGSIALLATQLFRALNEKLHPSWGKWEHANSDIPLLRPSKSGGSAPGSHADAKSGVEVAQEPVSGDDK